MIRSRLNLTCEFGHKTYAPPGELPDWIGKACGHGAALRPSQRCQSPLTPTARTTEPPVAKS